MRIDRLRIQNFKKFEEQTLSLHPQFTLLVGDNGSGKTTVLDALAVSASVWLVEYPDSDLQSSYRNILRTEIRLEPSREGDRIQFRERFPVLVEATGQIGDRKNVTWVRQIKHSGAKTTNAGAKEALEIIRDIYERDQSGEPIICPVLAYYGAGRAWLPSNRASRDKSNGGPARRWAAFYKCFSEEIRFAELTDWFRREAIAAGNRKGLGRPGFHAVQRAIRRCVPYADGVWFDGDREEIVLSIGHHAQPFSNLSAGQRMMLALVADIAIKAVTQNAYLLPPSELGPEDEPLPTVFQKTPGVVLIDELDVHLHPSWQRRVARDLKETFPNIQFIATTHSPQVVGEVPTEQILKFDDELIYSPAHSFGVDSSRILEETMDTKARTESIDNLLTQLAKQIDDEDFDGARETIQEMEISLGPNDPEITRARTLMSFVEQET